MFCKRKASWKLAVIACYCVFSIYFSGSTTGGWTKFLLLLWRMWHTTLWWDSGNAPLIDVPNNNSGNNNNRRKVSQLSQHAILIIIIFLQCMNCFFILHFLCSCSGYYQSACCTCGPLFISARRAGFERNVAIVGTNPTLRYHAACSNWFLKNFSLEIRCQISNIIFIHNYFINSFCVFFLSLFHLRVT